MTSARVAEDASQRRLSKAQAVKFATWMAARRCSTAIVAWPCTRPKGHNGGCIYNADKFDWLVAKWREEQRA